MADGVCLPEEAAESRESEFGFAIVFSEDVHECGECLPEVVVAAGGGFGGEFS